MKFGILFASMIAALATTGVSHAAAQEERPRIVSVSGQGEVQADPDRAFVTLGIEARKPKMEDARSEVARTVDAVLKLTRELKIDEKYVHATRVNVQPEYNWDSSGRERTLIGYFVFRQIEIELRDLDKLGPLFERSFDLGVNQTGDPRIDSTKRSDHERDAMGKAVEEARLNAQAVAKAAGARLGSPRTISANSGFTPPPPMPLQNKAMAVEAATSAQSYQPGQMTFNATVQIEYDLVPTAQ